MATATRRRASRRGTTTSSASALQQELGLGNVMEVPRLAKIVLNCGVGKATQQASLLDGAVADLTVITGQKPLVTKAKKSIAGFKLREGNAIGAKVTLRGARMWEFYDRLVSVAIPRIRDFRGMNPDSFDGRGQLHVRRDRAADLPGDRLRQDRHRPRHGRDDRDDGGNRRPGPRVARARSGFRSAERPSRGDRWPRRHSSRSNSARRSSRCAGTRVAGGAVAPRAVYRKFGLCRICFREMAHAGEIPGVTKASW